MRVLIVDDSRAMRMIVIRELRKAGFDEHSFEEAGNGKEALEQIRKAEPDLVLADWNMPEMSGLELLQALRAEGRALPFCFITTEATPELKKVALDAGAALVIAKPFTADSLRMGLAPYLEPTPG
jgi:two-component system chemotaxis response regulator CheY